MAPPLRLGDTPRQPAVAIAASGPSRGLDCRQFERSFDIIANDA